MNATAIILAAGAGSRLGELGRRYSKAMLPVSGRPLLAWVVDGLRRAGVGPIVVVGHPDDTALAACVQTEDSMRLVMQPERRGIADALRCALPVVASQAGYLACACDSLFRVDDLRRLIEIGQRESQAAVIGVLEMSIEATATRSAVRIEGERVVELVEKPPPGRTSSNLVAAPLYWLPQRFAPYCNITPEPGNELYISTCLNRFVADEGTVHPLRLRSRAEVTTPDDIPRTEAWLQGCD